MPQIPSGIITSLMHPPYGALARDVASALTEGLTQIQRIRGPVNVDAFGITFDFFTIPAAFGRTEGLYPEYEDLIRQFAPVYTLFDGHDVYCPAVTVYHEGELYYFDQLFPKRIDVYVQVGCTVIPFWLVARRVHALSAH